MLAALVWVAAAAGGPSALGLPGLNAVNLASGEGELYTELLAQKLHEGGLEVVSARDITALLGLERQKELLACAGASCVAELAGALGVGGLVLGDVGRLGASYSVNLKVLAQDTRVLAEFNGEHTDARVLLHDGARALLHQLAVTLRRPELEPGRGPPKPGPSGPPLTPLGLAGLLVGEVLLAVGVGSTAAAIGKMSALQEAQTPLLAQELRDAGKGWQSAGAALMIVGLVVLVAGAVLLIFGGRP